MYVLFVDGWFVVPLYVYLHLLNFLKLLHKQGHTGFIGDIWKKNNELGVRRKYFYYKSNITIQQRMKNQHRQ